MTGDIDRAKDEVRRSVWRDMDGRSAGRTGPVAGKIPNFRGAEFAAQRLAEVKAWQDARVIKANPDKAQAESRRNVLDTGRLLYMAVPKLASLAPFYELDPASLTASYAEVITGSGAAKVAPRVSVDQMKPVDVVLCGSVAVNRRGVRVGKGGGFSDIEVALLAETGLMGPSTLIVTTVHPLQVRDEELPETGHDFRVDLIVTPDEAIFCFESRQPTGIVREDLSQQKINAIPVLQTLIERRP